MANNSFLHSVILWEVALKTEPTSEIPEETSLQALWLHSRRKKTLWTTPKGEAFVWESPPIPKMHLEQLYLILDYSFSLLLKISLGSFSLMTMYRLTLPRKHQDCICAARGCVMGRLHSCPQLSEDYKRLTFCWNKGFCKHKLVNN